MRRSKGIFNYIAAFVGVFLMLLLFVVGAAKIPREHIRSNMRETAEYMCQEATSYYIFDFVQASKLDRFADCITLSIAYNLDENKPLESAMWTRYYGAPSNRMNEFLMESVDTDVQANQEYLRYWHGSAAAMRILHLFGSIRQIYLFHVFLMSGLFLALVLLLIHQRCYAETAALTLSMIIVSIWFVPLCLEYTYTFLCMFAAGILAVVLATRQKYSCFGIFFLITGMVTVYFDFLTTETLSLLVPLLLILGIRRKQGAAHGKEEWLIAFKSSLSWLIGYLGMWASKWVLAAIVLRENVMPYVTGHIEERLGGPILGNKISGNPYYDAIVFNLKKLFPYEYGISGAILVFVFIVIVIVLPVAREQVVMRKEICWSRILLYALIGLIPYIRFLVLHNHSIIHSFFTYRAQAATVMAVCMSISELVEINPNKHIIQKEVSGDDRTCFTGSDDSHALSE